MAAIEVSHLTKEYRLGALQSFKQSALNASARLLGRPVTERPLFKALDDVSFKVEPGEVVGIIGHNGAGKSTLLKMLARISTPTSGSVKVHGRIAPLIEVGAGFVPDFTGRENVYLNASILGMRKKEIDRKLDEIVDFAEMAEFIDTPVKRYSSGMQVKLAFAVATSTDSEILIVDEVLAVGDLAFQRKCFDRMESLIRLDGRTVLFVSHNVRQIERLCSRALLVDHGRLAVDGPSKHVCEIFFARNNAKIATDAASTFRHGRNVRQTGEVTLNRLDILDEEGRETNEIRSGTGMTIRGQVESTVILDEAEIVFGLHTTDMFYIASMGTAHIGADARLNLGRNTVDCKIDNIPLAPGIYAIRVGILDKNRREVFYGENLKILNVTSRDIPISKLASLGIVAIPASWTFASESQTSLTLE